MAGQGAGTYLTGLRNSPVKGGAAPAPGPNPAINSPRGTPAMTATAAYVLLLDAGVVPHLPPGTTTVQGGQVTHVKWSRLNAALRLCTPEESGIRPTDRSLIAKALQLAGH